jgi:hypothetical protein
MMRFFTALAVGFGLLAATIAAPMSSSTTRFGPFVCDKSQANTITPGVGAPNTCTPWQYEGLPGPSLEYVSYPMLLIARGSAFTTLDVLFKDKLAEFEEQGHHLNFDVDAVKDILCKAITIPRWRNDFQPEYWLCLGPHMVIKEQAMEKRDLGFPVPIELPSQATMAQLQPYLDNTTFVPQNEFDMLPGPSITSQELIERLCMPLEDSVCAAHPHFKRWVDSAVKCKDYVPGEKTRVCSVPESAALVCYPIYDFFGRRKVCFRPEEVARFPEFLWPLPGHYPGFLPPYLRDGLVLPKKGEAVEAASGLAVERGSRLEKRCWKCIFNCALCE